MSLSIEVSNLINKFIEKRGRNSIAILSRLSGISLSTIRRVANGETASSETTARALLPHIADDIKIKEIKELYFKDTLSGYYETVSSDKSLGQFIQGDLLDAEILCMTMNANGATEQDIIASSIYAGDIVKKRLDQHVLNELLILKDGVYFSEEQKSCNPEIVQRGAMACTSLLLHRMDNEKTIAFDLEVLSDDEFNQLRNDMDKLFLSYKDRIKSRKTIEKTAKPRFFSMVLGSMC